VLRRWLQNARSQKLKRSEYPTATGTPANGPFDFYWNGGQLLGVSGNSGNAGAPIVLNAGGNSSSLGACATARGLRLRASLDRNP